MFFRKLSVFALTCALGVVGCRDNGNIPPADLSMTGGGSGGTGGGTDMATGMKTYMTSTIAAMRMGAPGDYELDNVVAIAVTPSGSHLFAQDAAGGDFSAIRTNCSSTSTSHPCPVESTVKTVAVGHSVTIKGTFIKAKQTAGGSEEFYIDSITDNGAGTLPPVQMVALTDVQQSSVAMATTAAPTNKKWWFQHVTVSSPGTLTMYDPSPAAFKYTGTSACPSQFGWGVAPMNTAGANATLGCDPSCTTKPAPTTCTQPAAVALNNAEVLIGTDLYTGFTMSSDCKCASMYSDTPVTSSSQTTKLGGILIFDTVYMSTPVQAYIYLAPIDNTNDVHF